MFVLFKRSNYWFCMLFCLCAASCAVLYLSPHILPVPQDSFYFGLNFPPLVLDLFDSCLSQHITPIAVFQLLIQFTEETCTVAQVVPSIINRQTNCCVLVVHEITVRPLFLAGVQVRNMTPIQFKHPVSHGPDEAI